MTTLTTRFIGYCPCCDGEFKVREGLLVHHGYKRPGHGYIVGDCFGARRVPHEVSSEVAVEYHAALVGLRKARETAIENLKVAEETTVTRYSVEKREQILVVVKKSEKTPYEWQRIIDHKIGSLASEIRMISVDIARLEKLIAEWERKPLKTIEEEKAAKQMAKADRERLRTDKRAAKLADQVSRYQKRIDSACRTKNQRVLAEIYETCRYKLIDIDRSLTPATALALLDRDQVWRAFGLLTDAGFVLDPRNVFDGEERQILRRMRPFLAEDERIEWPL